MRWCIDLRLYEADNIKEDIVVHLGWFFIMFASWVYVVLEEGRDEREGWFDASSLFIFFLLLYKLKFGLISYLNLRLKINFM